VTVDVGSEGSWGRRFLRTVGRSLRLLLTPGYEQAVAKRLKKVVQDQRRDLNRLEKQVAHARRELSVFRDRQVQVRREETKQIRASLGGLGDRLRRQITWAQRVTGTGHRVATWQHQDALMIDRIGRLASGDEPIIVGPWTGEVGFELLYWVPFVRWASRKFGIDPGRFVVVSRGGTRPWYGALAGRYIDVFEFLTPDQFREALHVDRKQRRLRPLDLDLVRRVRQRLGISRVRLLHPTLMYDTFYPVWKKQASVQRIADFTIYEPQRAGERAAVLGRLPSNYVAVRFYFSDCFPDTPMNRMLVTRTLRALATHSEVVLLNPGYRVDDHLDFSEVVGDRLHRIDDGMAPEDNLAVQTAVIQHASAFVGTYGGFAYLAPFCGVDTLAFYSERNFFIHHLELAHQAFNQVDGGRLVVVDSSTAPLVAQALATTRHDID